MKRVTLQTIVAVTALFSASPSITAAEEIELKLASWGPIKHYVAQTTSAWIAEVNKQAKGKINIIEYPSGQLYGPKEMHTAVAKGNVDIGVVLQPRAMAMVPLLQGVYLPFAFNNIEDAATAYQGESREIIERALEKKRMKLIYANFTGGVQVYSSKRNIESMDDFKDLRILSTSPMMTEIMAKLGASPDTSIPQTEQYMALKRGVADASLNSIVGGFFQKTHEVAPNMSMMDMSFPTVLITMNLKKWNKIPEDVQKIMLDEGRKKEAYTLAVSKGWDEKFTGELTKSGANVTTLQDEERKKIQEASREIWEKWAKKQGPDAERLLLLNIK